MVCGSSTRCVQKFLNTVECCHHSLINCSHRHSNRLVKIKTTAFLAMAQVERVLLPANVTPSLYDLRLEPDLDKVPSVGAALRQDSHSFALAAL